MVQRANAAEPAHDLVAQPAHQHGRAAVAGQLCRDVVVVVPADDLHTEFTLTEVVKNKVNVSMITQGSSELNLAFVVKNSDTNAAVLALHDAFTLDKIN